MISPRANAFLVTQRSLHVLIAGHAVLRCRLVVDGLSSRTDSENGRLQTKICLSVPAGRGPQYTRIKLNASVDGRCIDPSV